MNQKDSLSAVLLVEASRKHTDLVADLIRQKPGLFSELFSLFAVGSGQISRRAAWVMDTMSEAAPELIHPYLDRLVDLLPCLRHEGLKRHALRILARSPLPEEEHRLGELIRLCFDWLLYPETAIAVKVHCMEILYRVSQREPDLKQELAETIEYRISEESAGFRNRGKKMLAKLYFEMNQLNNQG
jgi:hypothetical protein